MGFSAADPIAVTAPLPSLRDYGEESSV